MRANSRQRTTRRARRLETAPQNDHLEETPADPRSLTPTESHETSIPPLLRLPAELRNLIYSYVFVDDDGRSVIAVNKCDIKKRTPLLLTCRQIHNEAEDVFLRSLRFRIDCGLGEGEPAVKYLDSLGLKAWRIRYYELEFDGATKLRVRFATSLRHALLDTFFHGIADRVRDNAYRKSYERFVADYVAVMRYLRRHVGYRSSTIHPLPPMYWQCYAPISKLQVRIDEYHYMDLIETLLKDGGWVG